jgi:hypothetical protein
VLISSIGSIAKDEARAVTLGHQARTSSRAEYSRCGGSSGSEQGQAETPAADTAPSETSPLAEVPTAVTVSNSPIIRAVPTTTFSEWQTETVEVHPALAALAAGPVTRPAAAELDTLVNALKTIARVPAAE